MPFIKWILAAAILTQIVITPTRAAQIYLIDSGIAFYGEIVSGDFQKFMEVARKTKRNHILLDSAGGVVVEALQIANYIRENGFSTKVGARSVCASACVLMLAGGVIRSAEPGAVIAVHVGSGLFNERAEKEFRQIIEKHGVNGVRLFASIFERQAAMITLKQANFFLRSGVSLALLELASSIHHLDAKELTLDQAKEFNLINSD